MTGNFGGNRLKGTVKWYDNDIGRGKIVPEEGSEVFFRRGALNPQSWIPRAEQKVQYALLPDTEGTNEKVASEVIRWSP